jgi:hypothetical protein
MNQAPSVEPDEVNVGLLAVVGTFAAVVVVLIVVLLQAWFYNWRGSTADATTLPMNSPETPLGRALVEQEQQLRGDQSANRQTNLRTIPIEEAMKQIVDEMATVKKPPEKSGGKRGGP